MTTYPPIPAFDPQMLQKIAHGTFLPWLLKTKGRAPWLRRLARWGGRQMYAIAGTLPGLSRLPKVEQTSVLRTIRAGLPGAEQELADARRLLARARAKKGTTASEIAGLKRGIINAQARRDLARMGGGTLFGSLKSLATQPAKTLRLNWKAMNRLEKGMFVGSGAYGGYQFMRPQPGTYGTGPDALYANRGEHLGSEIGSNVGWLATGALPFGPMMGASLLLERAGAIPGRLLG